MISIIICCRTSDIPLEQRYNIDSTIECEYELIVVDNKNNQYNIFTAYNEGVKRAKGDILCFIHEDVLFHTKEWGKILSSLFLKHRNIGAIGVVGGQYLSRIKVAWWDASPMVGEIIQGNTDKSGIYSKRNDNGGRVERITEVAVVDGCFVCIRSSLFKENIIRWDDVSYKGFHLYDMDISMQVINSGYQVCVCPNILIEHKSQGQADLNYDNALSVFYKKWETYFPLQRGIRLSENEMIWRERLLETVVEERKKQCRISQLEHSHAYCLGKFILTPLRVMKNIFKR